MRLCAAKFDLIGGRATPVGAHGMISPGGVVRTSHSGERLLRLTYYGRTATPNGLFWLLTRVFTPLPSRLASMIVSSFAFDQ